MGVRRWRRDAHLILALALSLLTAVLTYGYLGRLGAREPVVVAAADLTRPQRLAPEHLKVVLLPAEAVHPQAVRDPALAAGRVLRQPVPAGAPILASQLAPPGDGGVWVALLHPGEAALFVPADAPRALGGAVQPGDRVALWALRRGEGAEGAEWLADVRVLDVRDADGRSLAEPRAGLPAGLLVALPEELLPRAVAALEHGRVYVALPALAAAGTPAGEPR